MTTRRAIVTGGSAGIGAEICRQLLAAGYEVISIARRVAASDDPRLTSIEVDLSDAEATHRVAEDLARERPATTIIHNAGAVREKTIEDATLDDVEALARLHLVAPLALLKANLAQMKADRYGRIVLVSSRAVLGLARRTAYSSTKAGMHGLARTWALELAPHGITCNVVAPGPIADTDIFDQIIPRDSPKRPAITRSVPVQRLGYPRDVARAVLFFAAPESDFITGQTLYVCGGTSVGSIVY
jgi:NAD(P)-dependent dehydrogenase (short-subunit alcohol dehydrogenase family)